MDKIFFADEVYERQRVNIERLAEANPADWFFRSQMELPPQKRTGFAPANGKCWSCGKRITGEGGITLERLGDKIITGCPHCNKSFCD